MMNTKNGSKALKLGVIGLIDDMNLFFVRITKSRKQVNTWELV
ncbi:hypothetical protein ADIWIN_3687 [Winogradskyella psychrotolerans RS-3]|uniref:Uncharacterized protein n=1 Tax=Winogradskyella psychrotolerans RS-3 TaxID=641526 RepID=S7VK83_9FLAO|nr:hypothetical protein ADIWIN_3687 [Winogradskyella psychrotolerans RS-3]